MMIAKKQSSIYFKINPPTSVIQISLHYPQSLDYCTAKWARMDRMQELLIATSLDAHIEMYSEAHENFGAQEQSYNTIKRVNEKKIQRNK